MTDTELDEIEKAARIAYERWDNGEVDWLPMMLELAGSSVPRLVAEMRRLLADRSAHSPTISSSARRQHSRMAPVAVSHRHDE